MGRQIVAVALGVVLSYLAAAAGGYLLYRLSHLGWSHQLPPLARYFFNPLIALLVGALVGVVAKSRPGAVAVLSLVPGEFGFLLFRRQDVAHLLILVGLGLLYLLIGAAAATVTFRLRNRSAPSNPSATSSDSGEQPTLPL
jgi:hypothetical protein